MECVAPYSYTQFFAVLGIICLILLLWWNEDRKMRKEFGRKYQLVLDQLNKTRQ